MSDKEQAIKDLLLYKEEYKKWVRKNRKKLIDKAVKPENLPPDDDWIQDEVWEKEYERN